MLRPLVLPGEDAQEGPGRAIRVFVRAIHVRASGRVTLLLSAEHPYFHTFTIGTVLPVRFSVVACQPLGDPQRVTLS